MQAGVERYNLCRRCFSERVTSGQVVSLIRANFIFVISHRTSGVFIYLFVIISHRGSVDRWLWTLTRAQ